MAARTNNNQVAVTSTIRPANAAPPSPSDTQARLLHQKQPAQNADDKLLKMQAAIPEAKTARELFLSTFSARQQEIIQTPIRQPQLKPNTTLQQQPGSKLLEKTDNDSEVGQPSRTSAPVDRQPAARSGRDALYQATTTTTTTEQDVHKPNARAMFMKSMAGKAGFKLPPALDNGNSSSTEAQRNPNDPSRTGKKIAGNDRTEHLGDGKVRKSTTIQGGDKAQHLTASQQIARDANLLIEKGQHKAAMAMVSLELHLNQDPRPSIITICNTDLGGSIPTAFMEKGVNKSTEKVAYFVDGLPQNPNSKDIKRFYKLGLLPQALYENRKNIKILGLGGTQMETSMVKLLKLNAKMESAKKGPGLEAPLLKAGIRFLEETAQNPNLPPKIKNEVAETIGKLESAMSPFSDTSFADAAMLFGFTASKAINGTKQKAAEDKRDLLTSQGSMAILGFCKANPDSTAIYVGSPINLFDTTQNEKNRKGLNSILNASLASMGRPEVTSITFNGSKKFEVKEVASKVAYGERPKLDANGDMDEDGGTTPIDETVVIPSGTHQLHIPCFIYEDDPSG